jgi:predicted HicB family RNase H-like nuclease
MIVDGKADVSPDDMHAFYADPTNQVPEGKPVRRRPRLSEPVPVRFPLELLARVRAQADADDRSVSSWIRRAVEHELERDAG